MLTNFSQSLLNTLLCALPICLAVEVAVLLPKIRVSSCLGIWCKHRFEMLNIVMLDFNIFDPSVYLLGLDQVNFVFNVFILNTIKITQIIPLSSAYRVRSITILFQSKRYIGWCFFNAYYWFEPMSSITLFNRVIKELRTNRNQT